MAKDCGFHEALRVLAVWALALLVRLSVTFLPDASDGWVWVQRPHVGYTTCLDLKKIK